MKRISSALLAILIFGSLALAEETSFRHVKVPDPQGHQSKAMLTFSDSDRAVEVRPVKGAAVTIPYGQIDKVSYQYTKRHRIKHAVIVGAILPPVGVVIFFTKYKSHWLEIDYHDQEVPRIFLLRMNKRDCVHILEAVNRHTGKDAEVLGNVDKRQK